MCKKWLYTVEAKCSITKGERFQKSKLSFYIYSNAFRLIRDALQSLLQDDYSYFPLIPLIFTHTSNTWCSQCHTQQAYPLFLIPSLVLGYRIMFWMLLYRPAASHVVLAVTVILTPLLPRERERYTDKERDEKTHTRHREGREESLARRHEAPFSGLSLSQSMVNVHLAEG